MRFRYATADGAGSAHLPRDVAELRGETPSSSHPPNIAHSRFARLDALARHRHLLFLQGPNGPFFRRLARRLNAFGARVTKVNFNGGDVLFWPASGALHFREPPEALEAFLEDLIDRREIGAIVLFGQCRPHHRTAMCVARRRQIPVYVFEEGYVRPWWITLEREGVNGDSELMHIDMARLPMAAPDSEPIEIRYAYQMMALWSTLYFLAGWALRFAFPHYRHHKPMCVSEAFHWLRSGWRRLLYSVTERAQLRRIEAARGRYFLVALQVERDSQIQFHSRWRSNASFIEAVVRSFARHAGADDLLVFKHHPMERGHAHYGALIQRLANTADLRKRVLYVHDAHLPSLLAGARGVVLINSTTGLQAMHHGTPVHVNGQSFYAKPGLVSPGSLDEFWNRPVPPDPELFARFIACLKALTQINGSFYVDAGLSAIPPTGSQAIDEFALRAHGASPKE